MIGFITSPAQAQAANDAVAQAQTDRGLPVFWLPGAYPIFSGEHVGKSFVPCDDAVLNTPLLGSPIMTPQDFPEFSQIITSLGGLNSRVDILHTDIINPDQ